MGEPPSSLVEPGTFGYKGCSCQRRAFRNFPTLCHALSRIADPSVPTSNLLNLLPAALNCKSGGLGRLCAICFAEEELPFVISTPPRRSAAWNAIVQRQSDVRPARLLQPVFSLTPRLTPVDDATNSPWSRPSDRLGVQKGDPINPNGAGAGVTHHESM